MPESYVLLLLIYALCLVFIFLYSLVQFSLTRSFKKNEGLLQEERREEESWPRISVQLPLYNEKYVVKRLIDAIVNLDYPRELLDIQVLDDSDDDSVELAKERIEYYRNRGIDIVHIRRSSREGYKAGALAYGLERCKGEFIAIFDADFLPHADFLKKSVAQFRSKPQVGVVQSRWGHLNKEYNFLTRLQAFALDAHFSVEQLGRNNLGHFINFNGTAGVWRKACIEDAGGWHSDTLTEDLDLSYRAQMKGWKFLYLYNNEAPAELPVEMNALKQQQYRWNKGAAECAKKHLLKVWQDGGLSFSTKWNASFHLLNSSIFLAILIISLLSVPLLFVKEGHPELATVFNLAAIFLLSFFILAYFYRASSRPMSIGRFIVTFLSFLSVSMGLSLHNSMAVLSGWSGKKSVFIRTPKFALQSTQDGLRGKSYRLSFAPLGIAEGLMMLYFLFGIISAFILQDYALLPFHVMLSTGYAMVFFSSLYSKA